MEKIYSLKLKWILAILLFWGIVSVFMAGAFIWKLDAIYSRLNTMRDYFLTAYEYQWMHENIDNTTFDGVVLSNEEDAWYTKYHVIAHAGGAIDGKVYTNSLEAWDASYAAGTRVFDADLAFTSDGVLVLRHSWFDDLDQIENEKSMSYIDFAGNMQNIYSEAFVMSSEEFLSTKIYSKYTAMDCEDMIQYMVEHDDLYVAIDIKGDITQTCEYLLNEVYNLGAEEVLDRIILSIYSEATYLEAMEVYPFENVVVRQYIANPWNYYELLNFCLKYDIQVVNIWESYVADEGVEFLLEHGINLYVATIDSISQMNTLVEKGFSGTVSNYLVESDWIYIR